MILYVTEGCNLKCVTCSYRQPLAGELSLDEIEKLAHDLRSFGLRRIVYSGGEPLLRRDFIEICRIFRSLNVKQTLLTNGLLLEKRAKDIAGYFTEIIVSMDGANADTHNTIRGVNSFELILKGIEKTIALPQAPEVSIRTVLQKQNFRELAEMIKMARTAKVNRISFLAADVSSEAYGRDTRGAVADESSIALNIAEVEELRKLIDSAAVEFRREFASGLVSESPRKLHHIADYYNALSGIKSFPKNICNAPMVSLVITSTGDVHPCFFLASFGNIRSGSVRELANSASIKETRKAVKEYFLERCQKCVCTLYTSPKNALLDRF